MSKELTLQEAALAWAQGKRVEAIGPSNEWGMIQQPGRKEGQWQPGVFSGANVSVFRFRLAPEPPAKRDRPWTPEEVPVGAVMRWKTTQTHASLICSHGDSCVFPAGATHGTPFEDALEKWEHSIDHIGTPDSKRTWLPCGVEVSE
jgi:hypothetical protein